MTNVWMNPNNKPQHKYNSNWHKKNNEAPNTKDKCSLKQTLHLWRCQTFVMWMFSQSTNCHSNTVPQEGRTKPFGIGMKYEFLWSMRFGSISKRKKNKCWQDLCVSHILLSKCLSYHLNNSVTAVGMTFNIQVWYSHYVKTFIATNCHSNEMGRLS